MYGLYHAVNCFQVHHWHHMWCAPAFQLLGHLHCPCQDICHPWQCANIIGFVSESHWTLHVVLKPVCCILPILPLMNVSFDPTKCTCTHQNMWNLIAHWSAHSRTVSNLSCNVMWSVESNWKSKLSDFFCCHLVSLQCESFHGTGSQKHLFSYTLIRSNSYNCALETSMQHWCTWHRCEMQH